MLVGGDGRRCPGMIMGANAMPDLEALASEAYVYGYPLVFDLDEVTCLAVGGS